MFDTVVEKVRPLDEYEKLYLRQKSGDQVNKQNVNSEIIKTGIKRAEAKLQKLNTQYENLKKRKFCARRGRNNRVFYKQMQKAIFDYDTTEESANEDVGTKK